MKWKKFRIKTKTEAEDIIISTLYDIGLEGAQTVSYTHLGIQGVKAFIRNTIKTC